MKRLATEVLAAALLLAGAAAVARAAPDDLLWQAITHVESRGDARAYNPKDGGTGIAQIRLVCLDDVNRIARRQRLDVRFAASDRNHPGAARRMWIMYLEYYGRAYAKATGRKPTPEVYARIWNGGPDGWRKASTRRYWARVRAALADLVAARAAEAEAAEDDSAAAADAPAGATCAATAPAADAADAAGEAPDATCDSAPAAGHAAPPAAPDAATAADGDAVS